MPFSKSIRGASQVEYLIMMSASLMISLGAVSNTGGSLSANYASYRGDIANARAEALETARAPTIKSPPPEPEDTGRRVSDPPLDCNAYGDVILTRTQVRGFGIS